MRHYRDIIIESIVTCLYVGKIKYAPGTFGSLLAFPISYILVSVILTSGVRFDSASLLMHQAELVTLALIIVAVILLLFTVGVFCTSKYIAQVGREDPKEVVIDELVGQMIVIFFGSMSVVFAHINGVDHYINSNVLDFCLLFLLPFFLFRVFDICKPFPIDWIDKNIHGGMGVMLDDVLAAIFALVAQYCITFLIIDLLVSV